MHKCFTLPVANHEGTDKVARRIFENYLSQSENFTVFLEGSLGAGKTYLVRALLRLLGVEEGVTSPTYALMHEYDGFDHKFAHFDFYRLEDPQDFFARGFAEVAEDLRVSCFVEWGNKIAPIAQATFSGRKFIIRIEHGIGVGMRKITLLEKT